jgi:hypothetical protein
MSDEGYTNVKQKSNKRWMEVQRMSDESSTNIGQTSTGRQLWHPANDNAIDTSLRQSMMQQCNDGRCSIINCPGTLTCKNKFLKKVSSYLTPTTSRVLKAPLMSLHERESFETSSTLGYVSRIHHSPIWFRSSQLLQSWLCWLAEL